jgi:hypothetical protein
MHHVVADAGPMRLSAGNRGGQRLGGDDQCLVGSVDCVQKPAPRRESRPRRVVSAGEAGRAMGGV